MTTVSQRLSQIVAELQRTTAAIDDVVAAELVATIAAAPRVFVAGAGRSGLAMRGFAMRLMHLGRAVHVVGETTTPGITADDLLLIGSGSGTTASLVDSAETARRLGARVALITIAADSPIGALAGVVLTIPAPTPKLAAATGFTSTQPLGSLFEQSLALVLDALVMALMDELGADSAAMFSRHANLE